MLKKYDRFKGGWIDGSWPATASSACWLLCVEDQVRYVHTKVHATCETVLVCRDCILRTFERMLVGGKRPGLECINRLRNGVSTSNGMRDQRSKLCNGSHKNKPIDPTPRRLHSLHVRTYICAHTPLCFNATVVAKVRRVQRDAGRAPGRPAAAGRARLCTPSQPLGGTGGGASNSSVGGNNKRRWRRKSVRR